jgi:hypothetical protein
VAAPSMKSRQQPPRGASPGVPKDVSHLLQLMTPELIELVNSLQSSEGSTIPEEQAVKADSFLDSALNLALEYGPKLLEWAPMLLGLL